MAKLPVYKDTPAPKLKKDKHNEITDNYNESPQPCDYPPTGGYPSTGVKKDGIKIRGTGKAVRGVKARGPMG